jgi:hypothetical protein
MSRVWFNPSVAIARRPSLPRGFPTARFLTMSTANRFTALLGAALGWTLTWARPVFA